MKSDDIVPLIIDGLDVTTDVEFVFETNRFGGKPSPKKAFAQGASTETCLRAVESCAKAFPSWKRTDADQKRKLFQQLKHVSRYMQSRHRRFTEIYFAAARSAWRRRERNNRGRDQLF